MVSNIVVFWIRFSTSTVPERRGALADLDIVQRAGALGIRYR